eukprot:594853-Pleurochrysis_carterae.AAC.5
MEKTCRSLTPQRLLPMSLLCATQVRGASIAIGLPGLSVFLPSMQLMPPVRNLILYVYSRCVHIVVDGLVAIPSCAERKLQ